MREYEKLGWQSPLCPHTYYILGRVVPFMRLARRGDFCCTDTVLYSIGFVTLSRAERVRERKMKKPSRSMLLH